MNEIIRLSSAHGQRHVCCYCLPRQPLQIPQKLSREISRDFRGASLVLFWAPPPPQQHFQRASLVLPAPAQNKNSLLSLGSFILQHFCCRSTTLDYFSSFSFGSSHFTLLDSLPSVTFSAYQGARVVLLFIQWFYWRCAVMEEQYDLADNYEDIDALSEEFDYGNEPYMFEPVWTDDELRAMDELFNSWFSDSSLMQIPSFWSSDIVPVLLIKTFMQKVEIFMTVWMLSICACPCFFW